MNKEEFIKKIKEIKTNVPDEQFFLEYNKCIYDILDKNEQLQQENQKYKEAIGKAIGHINVCIGEEGLEKDECRYLLDILKEVG